MLQKLAGAKPKTWVDALEHSDESIRLMGLTELKNSKLCMNSALWEYLPIILPALMLDESITIRKEAIDFIRLIDFKGVNEETEEDRINRARE